MNKLTLKTHAQDGVKYAVEIDRRADNVVKVFIDVLEIDGTPPKNGFAWASLETEKSVNVDG